MNWGGLSTPDIQGMYEEAIEFFKADAERHKKNGRQVYSEEVAHYVEVIEERVRRLSNTVNAVLHPGDKAVVGRKGRKVIVGQTLYPSLRTAALSLGVSKHAVNLMIRDGEAKFA